MPKSQHDILTVMYCCFLCQGSAHLNSWLMQELDTHPSTGTQPPCLHSSLSGEFLPLHPNTPSVFLLCGSRTLHLLPPNVQDVAPVNLPHTHTAFVDKNVSWGNWLNKQGKFWEPQLLEAVFVCCCCFKLHLGHFPPKYIESRFHIDFFHKFNFSYSLWQLYYESEKALSNSIVEYWNVNLWAPYLMK